MIPRKKQKKWKFVRNKLGDHLDTQSVMDMCLEHNFKGVFTSVDMESDIVMLNMLLLQSAINSSRKSYDIFGRDLNMKAHLLDEATTIIGELNGDLESLIKSLKSLMDLIYQYCANDKISATSPEDRRGIVYD